LPPRQLSVPLWGNIRVLYCDLTQLCSARIRPRGRKRAEPMRQVG
jgi:hypothetical protein